MATPSHAPVPSYRNLVAWQRAMDLVALVFELMPLLPRGRRTAVVAQITRAAVSVPSNIAEGYARRSSADFGHFLRVSLGSLREVETLLLICERIGIRASEAKMVAAWQAADETAKCLQGLLRRVESGQESLPSHSALSPRVATPKELADKAGTGG